jgi:hypothetical protein
MPELLRDFPRRKRKATAPRDWPKHVDACANCTCGPSQQRPYGRCGYCACCYRLCKYIQDVQLWNRETLKHIPKSGHRPPAFTNGYSDEEFEACRRNSIEQLKRRLDLLLHREEIRRHEVPVSALDLEKKFAEIAKLLRVVRSKAEYPQNATYLGSHFGEAERRVIYALLEEIIEKVPWRGIIISKYKT